MMNSPSLHWLPTHADWRTRLKDWRNSAEGAWETAVSLANERLDFVQTNMLDSLIRQRFADAPPPDLQTKPVRLALLGSATLAHLHAAIRVAAVRRGLWVEIYENDYGQYRQELVDPSSALHVFAPTAILFCFDAYHLSGGIGQQDGEEILNSSLDNIRDCWRLARSQFRCPILHQTALPVLPPILGSNEHRLNSSGHHLIRRINNELRLMADAENVDLVAVDDRAAQDGMACWHDPALWHRSKQEIIPTSAPVYGDLVSRVLAAQQGRSAKCLVLDLDNTLWGGVIGDDGLDGLVLGQGSALGEGFVAVQKYAKSLAQRGVILAVCSKNDEANALEPFERHPDMILRRQDIACFVANWTDKASNIRFIAQDLNIGLDSLVFLDDNPMERDIVRQQLPMVAVPEAPEDPALVPYCLADAGYFEGLAITDEDKARTQEYQSNRARAQLKESTTDLPAFLRGLDMQLLWRRFDRLGLPRIVQLINKTNQFNLTTRRYSEDDVVAIMDDPNAVGLQLRLLDRFGDNGIIAIVIGKLEGADLHLDTWLMSCRVLGRQVEATTLNLIATQAKAMGARRLIGYYRPTAKNAMVKDHYAGLGFRVESSGDDGSSVAVFDLDTNPLAETFIVVTEG